MTEAEEKALKEAEKAMRALEEPLRIQWAERRRTVSWADQHGMAIAVLNRLDGIRYAEERAKKGAEFERRLREIDAEERRRH